MISIDRASITLIALTRRNLDAGTADRARVSLLVMAVGPGTAPVRAERDSTDDLDPWQGFLQLSHSGGGHPRALQV
jgi:hypothetical protein